MYEGISDQNLLIIQDRKTTSKTRIYNGDLYVLRYDDEIVDDLFKEDEEVVIHLFDAYIQSEQPELVLYQDYNKGMLTKKVIRETLAICKKYNIKTAVDPKRNNFFEYHGVTLFKPNLKEVKEALNITTADKESIHKAAVVLRQKLEATKILITLSENGALILEDEIIFVNAIPRNIVDVSGAGDSVIAVASMCLVNNFDNQKILAYSNIAGGMVCEKAGVVSINLEALKKEIETQSK